MASAPQLIPTPIFDLYDLKLHPIQTLDDSGEACRYCQDEDAYVQVQAYGTHEVTGEPVMASSCCRCLGHALFLAHVSMLEPVTVEYEHANPVGVA